MKLLQIDTGSFTRLTWINQKAIEEWAPRLQNVRSLTYRLEIASVAQDLRRVTTVNLTPQTFENDLDSFAKQGLIFVPMNRIKKYTGFAHRHEYASGSDPDTYVFGIVCRNIKDGMAFQEFIRDPNGTNHHGIGDLLGYPKCCRDFFQYTFGLSQIPDTPWHQGLNSPAIGEFTPTYRKVEGYAALNAMLRYWGIRLAPHLPCSYHCDASTKWVDDIWWPLAQKLDSKAAEDLMILLEMPLRFDVHKGIAIVDTPLFRGYTNSVPCYPAHVLDFSSIDPKFYTHEEMAKWTSPGLTYPYDLFLKSRICQ